MISRALLAASYTPLVLSLLAQGERYGYQIIQRIQQLSDGKIRWTAGTLYPLLHRLEARGLVAATWRMSEAGRERKYYSLTPQGHQALDAQKREWLDVHAILIQLWGSAPQFT